MTPDSSELRTDIAASGAVNQTGIVSDSANAAGSGYAPADTITLTGGTASPFGVLTVNTTQLVSTAKNSGGSGYAANDTITLAGGTFTQAAVIKVLTVSSGVIQTFSIQTPGVYSVNSTTFTQGSTSGSGTGATFNTALFGVQSATVSTPGSYSVLPTNPVSQGSTSGSGTGATFNLSFACLTLTAKYTGTLGNSLSVIVGAGTGSTTGTPTFKITVQLPNLLAEVFDNIGGTGNTLFVNMANAINQGTSGLRGPSQLVVATAGAGTTAPTVPATVTMSGGTDGVTTITTSVMIGVDTVPRKGIYALRGTGSSVAMLADLSDSTSWSTQVAFGLSEGIYMIMVGPAGDTISNAASTKSTAGIDSYAAKLLFGDWVYWLDTVNGVTRLISPQGFVAGLLSNLSPQNSSLNKQLYGIVGTQKSLSNQVYSSADLQALGQAGIDLITNPIPAGAQFGVRFGHNTSSNAVIHGDNYTRMTNYIASTINAGMGIYIGQLASNTERLNAKTTLDAFFAGLKQQKMIADWQTVLDKTNNPQTRVALGYQQADIKVVYLSVVEFFLVNLQGGQSVQITRTSTQPSA
jgi:hypothetical protein